MPAAVAMFCALAKKSALTSGGALDSSLQMAT